MKTRELVLLCLWMLMFGIMAAFSQNPQTQTAPLFATNAKYTNGTAPGYWPTQQAVGARPIATGLNINVGPGTANCGSGTIIQYAGGTFALTASVTNRIYLDTASSCAPAVKTSAFTGTDIPLAVVVTSGSAITSIVDVRTPFGVPPSSVITVNVNGISVPSPNFNNSTPPSGSNSKNVIFQNSGSNVSAELVGDGDPNHYLNGTGVYSTPAGSLSSSPLTRQGTIFPSVASTQFTDAESSAIYEATPHLISSSYTKVFKLWFSRGWSSPVTSLYYAESPDGMPDTWTIKSTAVISGFAHGWVFKVGSTYHAYGATNSGGTSISHWTSTDGITWTLSASNVFTATQVWQGSLAGDIALVANGTTWYALVDWQSASDGLWRTGLWTNTASGADGSWTAYAGNPVLPTTGTSSTGMCGGFWFGLVSGTYYAIGHCNGANGSGSGGNLPTDIFEYTASNPQSWTPVTTPVIQRSTFDEGAGLSTGQVADPYFVEADTSGRGTPRTYVFYEGTEDGTQPGTNADMGQHMKVSVINSSLSTALGGSLVDGATLDAGTGVTGGSAAPCYPNSADTATFIGSAGELVTSYTSPCGYSFITYTADGASPTTPMLTGANTVTSSSSYADALSTLAPNSADYSVSMQFYAPASSSNSVAVIGRANSGAATEYFWGCTPNGASSSCNLAKSVAGTVTTLGTYTANWPTQTTHTLMLSMVGNKITAWFDGVSAVSVTDSAIAGPGQGGFRVYPGTTGTSFNIAYQPASGVTAGTYTNATVTVDTQGKVTAASTGSGGGGYPAAQTLTASSSASLVFSSCIDTHRDYELRFSDLAPATASADILVQVSTDGGSTWDTTSGHYVFGRIYEGISQSLTLGSSNQQNATGFSLLAGTGGNLSKLDGTAYLYNLPNSTAHKLVRWELLADDASVGTNFQRFGEVYNQTAAVNALRVIATSGNLTSGTVVCQPLPQ